MILWTLDDWLVIVALITTVVAYWLAVRVARPADDVFASAPVPGSSGSGSA